MKKLTLMVGAAALMAACTTAEDAVDEVVDTVVMAASDDVCTTFGPQTPRDISMKTGTNANMFDLAPASTALNLCNIHSHTNAEHKGPGFSVYAGPGPDGGYQCNGTDDLTAAELAPYTGERSYEGAEPGDTIEVHWVHSSCDVQPGEGLGSCLTDACTDPKLRVETQVFLVVNDANALDMTQMDYAAGSGAGAAMHQASMIPSNTGDPVIFRGSTTGPSYDQKTCSPVEVTWSVRPQCTKIDVASLHAWGQDNAFMETKSHGVRDLVTDPRLLSTIK